MTHPLPTGFVFIQLLNGENIITKGVANNLTSPNTVTLDRPRRLMIHQTQHGHSIVLVKMGAPFIDSPDTIDIAKSAILTIIPLNDVYKSGEDANKKLIDEYKRQISPISTNIANISGLRG